mmetsp:Transcript_5818/g.12934  ORF Transcript_5818/g.12934 Transcript_5818/m.12934 type:complete len:247 (-) Transcript_5818:1021-1761(-)
MRKNVKMGIHLYLHVPSQTTHATVRGSRNMCNGGCRRDTRGYRCGRGWWWWWWCGCGRRSDFHGGCCWCLVGKHACGGCRVVDSRRQVHFRLNHTCSNHGRVATRGRFCNGERERQKREHIMRTPSKRRRDLKPPSILTFDCHDGQKQGYSLLQCGLLALVVAVAFSFLLSFWKRFLLLCLCDSCCRLVPWCGWHHPKPQHAHRKTAEQDPNFGKPVPASRVRAICAQHGPATMPIQRQGPRSFLS